MGAPKQKWTSEEEAALKAGIAKHGAGKWRTILKDPEFSAVLCLRSNVDLKDKWRNMNVTAHGCGSREKARLALKRNQQIIKHDDNAMKRNQQIVQEDSFMAVSTELHCDDEIISVKPLATSNGTLPTAGSRKQITRLDNLIFEAITSLKERTGSNRTSIAMYIEEQYWTPPNFIRLLSAKLKLLTSNGKLIKVKRKYRIPPSMNHSEAGRSSSLLLEGKPKDYSPKVEMKKDVKIFSRSQIDADLVKMTTMTAHEAAMAAAQAVAEAEAAIAEAEEAAKEAEAAEADAEVAQAFAEAAMKALQNAKLRTCGR